MAYLLGENVNSYKVYFKRDRLTWKRFTKAKVGFEPTTCGIGINRSNMQPISSKPYKQLSLYTAFQKKNLFFSRFLKSSRWQTSSLVKLLDLLSIFYSRKEPIPFYLLANLFQNLSLFIRIIINFISLSRLASGEKSLNNQTKIMTRVNHPYYPLMQIGLATGYPGKLVMPIGLLASLPIANF